MRTLLSGLLGSVFFLVVGAVLAGIEASLLVLSEPRMRALRDELGDRGKLLDAHLVDPTRVLSRVLAGRVLAPIVATTIATDVTVHDHATVLNLALVVLAIALSYGAMSEVAVTVGRRRARTIAPTALFWVRPLLWLLAPFAFPLTALGRWTALRLVEGTPSVPPPVTEKEVEYVVEEAQSAGAVDPVSSQMLTNVFALKERTAREIMVPRTQIVALELDTPVEAALDRLVEDGHSRVPVYRGQIDNVVGVLVSKDLVRVMTERQRGKAGPATIDPIVRRPAIMVAENQPVLSVLRELQSRRMHLAVVVDEFGSMIGIVSLEDILEELVGEIEDEHDEAQAQSDFVEVEGGRYMARATMSVGDLEERLDVRFPEDGDYASLGGFLAARAGKVPDVGTVVVWSGLRFIVREGDKRRATRVEIVREPTRAETQPPSPEG